MRTRDEAAAGSAEAPGALDGFGDPDPRAGDDRRRLALRRRQEEGLAGQIGLVLAEADPQRLGQLARAGAEVGVGLVAAALAHHVEAVGRLQRPDQDRGGFALGFGDGVEQTVDPVGEVDVGVAGRPEQDPGALGQPDVGVTGGVVGLVALGLDDGSADAIKQQRAADQVAGDGMDRAVKELASQPVAQERSSWTRSWTALRVSRASAICSASGAEPVPPAIRFDSSQLLRCSTS
jgi:hypothetical protein